MQLPERFDTRGLLPPGDYEVTFEQLRQSLLVNGPRGGSRQWNRAWRAKLVDNAEVLVDQLWAVGVDEVFLDGSFVEDKPRPNDIDGYFVCSPFVIADGSLVRSLNALDPRTSWTWDPRFRTKFKGYAKAQLPMWHAYRVELYPHYSLGSSGIRDRFGNELSFPAAFRTRRGTDEPKGIVKIKLPDRGP